MLETWGLGLLYTYGPALGAIARELHEIKMRTRSAPKNQNVAIITDGFTNSQPTFWIVLAVTVPWLCFLPLYEIEQADREALVAKLGPCIRKLIKDGTVIASIVSNSASNLEKALDPKQFQENLSRSLGKPIYHVHCCCHRTTLALPDVEGAFQLLAEFMLRFHRPPEHP
jgi:hypothetical protein